MDENQKYEIIKKLVDTCGNKRRAALKIGCTERHINRLIKGYKEKGKEFFIHGNRGRQPAITIPADIKKLILDLYSNKYYSSNLTHFSELLEEYEGIKVSTSSILDLEDAHPRQPRSTYLGEMLQMDASEHLWFGDSKTQLHIAIDDASGTY